MAEKYKSFQEFYYNKTSSMVGVEVVANYAIYHENTDIYDGEMYCPECRAAKLSFVNQTYLRKAHLRRLKSSSHIDGCSYNYPRASKRTIQKHFAALSYEQIQDKLNAMLHLLFKNTPKENPAPKPVEFPLKNPMLLKTLKKQKTEIESLRRKRLGAWIEDFDIDEYFVFYGKVKLKSIEKEKIGSTDKYNILEVYNVDKTGNSKFRTSLFRGSLVDKVKEDDLYNIAIVGKIGSKGWQIEMPSIYAVKYREVK